MVVEKFGFTTHPVHRRLGVVGLPCLAFAMAGDGEEAQFGGEMIGRTGFRQGRHDIGIGVGGNQFHHGIATPGAGAYHRLEGRQATAGFGPAAKQSGELDRQHIGFVRLAQGILHGIGQGGGFRGQGLDGIHRPERRDQLAEQRAARRLGKTARQQPVSTAATAGNFRQGRGRNRAQAQTPQNERGRFGM